MKKFFCLLLICGLNVKAEKLTREELFGKEEDYEAYER